MKKGEIEIISELCKGLSVSGRRLGGDLLVRLMDEQMLISASHGSRVAYKASHPKALEAMFSRELALAGLASDGSGASGALTRADLVELTGDSKAVRIRSCPGFPVNSYEPLMAKLAGRSIVIDPEPGSFIFICNWQEFTIPEDVVVVGVENMENFRMVRQQRYLFEYLCAPVLFVSRYPQSGDLVAWLRSITNRYIHFGDLDLAGIHIFQNEFFRHLGSRSEFFVPADVEQRLSRGSLARYDSQLSRFGRIPVSDPRLSYLVSLIHKYHRGYDQEGFLCAYPR